MRATSLACLACTALSSGFASSARAQTAYMGDLNNALLHEVVIATGAIVNTVPVSTGQDIFSLDQHPISGQTYTILSTPFSAGLSRDLATIDPTTGAASTIGAMGDSFNALAFDDTGTLWATTGDGAITPESLWTIDITTGTPSYLRLSQLGVGWQTPSWRSNGP